MPDNESPVSEGDLLAYVGGRADAETKATITRERKIAGSYVSDWFGRLRTAAEKPFDVDWEQLIALEEAADADEEKALPSPSVGRSRLLRQWTTIATAAALLIGIAIGAWLLYRDRSGRIVAQLDDPFGRITKTSSGELVGLENIPAAWRQQVGQMLRTENVDLPPDLPRPKTGTRAGSRRFYVRPVSTVVRSDRPRFEWNRQNDGETYRLSISHLDGGGPVGSPIDLAEPHWDAPFPLDRGVEYSWSVDLITDGRTFAPVEEAPVFRILDAESDRQVGLAERASHGSHLVLASIYFTAGLVDEGQRELELLRVPGLNSALIDQLKHSIESQR